VSGSFAVTLVQLLVLIVHRARAVLCGAFFNAAII
jgi:hypothetical protein